MSIPSELLEEIGAFVRAQPMAETTFGRLAANDGKLVGRLRAGKGITTRTVEKVRAFMSANGGPDQAGARAGPLMPADVLGRIAVALERLAPAAVESAGPETADAFVWHAEGSRLEAVASVNRVEIYLLKGIDGQMDLLLDNTRRFAKGLPANNALLWGARGMGKSSLVKAVHARVNADRGEAPADRLALVEIHRDDIGSLPRLLEVLRGCDRRVLLFCDDLTFDGADTSYKSLKAVLEGGIEGRPDNVVLYATSNRRHLMPRDMIENERSTAINPSEAVEEKVSLSDRFGLWLGFHACDQATYLAMVAGYAEAYGLDLAPEDLRARAIEWSVTRGGRSGRVAWQFTQHLAGRLGKTLPA